MGQPEDQDVSAVSGQAPNATAREDTPEVGRLFATAGLLSPAAVRVTLLGAAGFLAAISWQPVVPFLPLHLSRIGFTAAQIGILASLLNLAMGVVELEVGHIAGVFGRRWTLLGGFLTNTVAMLWLAQARAGSAVAGALATAGASRAMMWPPLTAAVADTASAQTRGRAFGIFWFWTALAFLAGPALGGLIATWYGEITVFYVGSAFSLLAVPAVIAVTEPSRLIPGVTMGGVKKVLRVPAIFRLSLASFLYWGVSGIWLTFLPLYAARQGVSDLTIGWVFTLQGLTYALVQIPTGRLVDRLGPGRLLIPGLIGRSMLAALAPLFHTPLAFLLAGAAYIMNP